MTAINPSAAEVADMIRYLRANGRVATADVMEALAEQVEALRAAYQIVLGYAQPPNWERYAEKHSDYALVRDLKRAAALAAGGEK